jgi:O-acetylserine/cysteine efflux transporter
MKPRHLALILLIDLVWAFNLVAVKLAVADAQPLTAVALRYGIVLVACLPWLRWQPGRMRVVLVTGLVAGALFMGLGGLSFALAYNVSALAIAGQLGVPFSLLLAVVFYREQIRWPRITAVALCFAGVAVMGFDPAIAAESVALWLTVAASLAWAAGNLLFRKLAGISVLTIHAWLALISVPVLLVASIVFEPGALAHVANLKPATWGWLAYSALGASLLGHGGMSWLFQRYPVSTVSPLTLPTPLLSVMVGIAVFGTPITPQMIVGGVLTIIGVGIITLRTAQRRDDDDAQRRDDDDAQRRDDDRAQKRDDDRAQKRDDDTVQKRDMINE